MKFKNLEEIEFYALDTDRNKIYAEFVLQSDDSSKPDIKKLVDINDASFKSYLRLIVIPSLNEYATENDIVQNVKDYCTLYGNEDTVSVKVRTAGKLIDGLIEYSLYDKQRRIVKITADGWCVKQDSTHKFVDRNTSGAQVVPKESSKSLLSLLKPYINADKKSTVLFIIWLVQAFCEGNHSVLLISAGRGSGKSTLTKIIRKLIDPSIVGVSALQSEGDNLITTLTNSYLVAFDNTRTLTQKESDLLCIATTGGTYSKRTSYSTNDLSVYNLHNTIVINGIDILPSESDFAERCLLLTLKPIDSKHRVLETELEKNFQKDLPIILGKIFSTISKAISIISTLHPEELSRMSDSYIEMLAIAQALGIDEERFSDIYFENLRQIDKARSHNDLIYAVQEYMSKFVKGRSLEGTATEVYAKIRNNFSGNRTAMPNSVSHFTRKLKAEYSSFLAAGLTVNVDDTSSVATHIKIIKNK